MKVPTLETGVIRVFLVDLPEAEIARFRTPEYSDDDTTLWPLKAALGASYLDEDFVEVFPVSDLGELGLAGYLIEGNGVPEDQVNPMRPQLEALKGHVLLVFSQALGEFAQTLTPRSPLRHIATFQDDRQDIAFEPLPSEAAKPGTGPTARKRPVSDAAMSGRIATVVLLFMFIFIAIMVWIGS